MLRFMTSSPMQGNKEIEAYIPKAETRALDLPRQVIMLLPELH